MIRSKVALIVSMIILMLCMYLFFPFPNNVMIDARATFMSFPIRNQNGYIPLGIMGSVLFIIAIILLVFGLKKYRFRTVVVVVIAYSLLPNLLITMYQETVASGIAAISYDQNGTCQFEEVEKDLVMGECHLELHNRGNEDVAFELEFMDSFSMDDDVQMESIMNGPGPYPITLEANQRETIQVKELLDLSEVTNPISSGTSSSVPIKLRQGDKARTL